MSWTEALLRLQEIDQHLAAARHRLSEINRALQEDAAVREARKRAKKLTAEAQKTTKIQRELERQVKQLDIEREQAESRLYSGNIKNPREMQDMQAKVDSLKRRRINLEDKLLEAMIAREEAEVRASEAAAALEAAETYHAAQAVELQAEQATLQRRIKKLQGETEEIEKQVPGHHLDAYRHLQTRLGNPAIARLKGNVCSVCGIEVIVSRQQSAKGGKVTYCDSCGRLLIA